MYIQIYGNIDAAIDTPVNQKNRNLIANGVHRSDFLWINGKRVLEYPSGNYMSNATDVDKAVIERAGLTVTVLE